MKRFTKVLMAFVVGVCLFVVVPTKVEGESIEFDLKKFSIDKTDLLTGDESLGVDFEMESKYAKEDFHYALWFDQGSIRTRRHAVLSSVKDDHINFQDNYSASGEVENLEFRALKVSKFSESGIKLERIYSPYTKDELIEKGYGEEIENIEVVTSENIEEYTLNYKPKKVVEIPLDIETVKMSQEKDVISFNVKFKQDIPEHFTSEYEISFSLEGENSGSWYRPYFNYEKDIIQSISNNELLCQFHIDFLGVKEYDSYKLSSVSISKEQDLENHYQSKYYPEGNNNVVWNTDERVELTKENNPNELIKAEDLEFTHVIEQQNFGERLKTQFFFIKNKVTGDEYTDVIDPNHVIFDGIPTDAGKTGSVEKMFEYDFKVYGEETKTLQIPVTVNYYGEPQGTVIMPETPPQYAVKYDEIENEMFGESIDYYVRLNDGTLKKEKARVTSQGGGSHIQGHINIYGAVGQVSLKYKLEKIVDEWLNKDNYILVEKSFYLVDDAGNLVDMEGNIRVPFKERKNVKYQTLNDKVHVSSLEGSLPKTAVVNAKEIDLGMIFGEKVHQAYDITLEANHETIQPVEAVSVTVELSEKLKDKEVEVYYVDDQGNKELVEGSVVKDGTVTFKTDHFSTYSVVEKNKGTIDGGDDSDNGEITPSTPNQDDSNKGETNLPTEKDDVNTGYDANVMLWIAMMLVGIGGFIFAKKQNQKA